MTTGPGSRPAHHALVLADGDAPSRADLDAAWPGWDEGVDYVVAADGGARLAASLGLRLDEWVGDGDSIDADGLETLRVAGVPVNLASADKDESDTELGLLAALAAGASRVTILGALGGVRFDHALANIQLLGHDRAHGIPLAILDTRSRIRLLEADSAAPVPATLDLAGRVGDVVSLVPLEDVVGVSTHGLRYPLQDENLVVGPARGLSNVREAGDASVALRRGRLLVIEVPATLPE